VTRKGVAVTTVLVALMAGFGLAVYSGLGLVRHIHDRATAGTGSSEAPDLHPLVTLPGSLYVVSGGDLLRLRGDTVRAVLNHDATRRWMQPAVAAGGSLLVVARGAQSSDLYRSDAGGGGLERLTDDAAAPLRDGSLERNHWTFHPRSGADGTVWYSYDAPKAGFRVDLAVWSRPATGTVATRWSSPVGYTGGDVEPVPTPAGGVIYARYVVGAGSQIRSQLWLQTGPRDPGHALTPVDDDCSQPDLAPGGGTLAMVCTHGGQGARVEVAGFDGRTLGPPRVLAAGSLCAFPTWAPDGGGLVYIAPTSTNGDFTLWWLAGAAGARPSAAQQVLAGAALDATSRPAWAS
jgi:hypothetical protein